MSAQGNVDSQQQQNASAHQQQIDQSVIWAPASPTPLSPTPAVMMPPLIFSPTASNTNAFNQQQQTMLFSPILLPAPSPQQATQQFFTSGQIQQQPQVFSPICNSPQRTTNFSVQPIPGICISSPVSKAVAPPALNTTQTTEPNSPFQTHNILTPASPTTNHTAITGFFSPTGAQSQYYFQQRFQNLFLSPGDAMDLQYTAVSAPSPQQEYYNYASMTTGAVASQLEGYPSTGAPMHHTYAPHNQTFSNNNNNYRTGYHQYGKSTYNVLPKRKLEFPQKPPTSTKRDAVMSCLTQLEDSFRDKIDDAGFRGPTALRIRVKTWNAIKHIVPFLEQADKEVKISKVSFPKSTKGLGKVLRGFLAYMLVENLEEREKMQKLFEQYQTEHDSPFKKLEITVK